MLTKATVIPWTILHLIFLSDMKEMTIRTTALPIFTEKVTNRHFIQIIDMQELTVVHLFAQTPYPVLTHSVLLSFGVTVQTLGAFATISFLVELTGLH